jgi:hypothetical protein
MAIGFCAAACGVSDTDASLWQQTKDPGGAMYSPTQSGAAGEPQGSAGDSNTPPPGSGGGVPQGSGNTPAMGGFPMQGSGGTTGVPMGMGGIQPSNGGFMTGSGGMLLGAGGMPFGSGGTTMMGSGGTTMMGAGGTTMAGPPGKCTFKFDATTLSSHGIYGPANVGAIWITDSSNKFVKTLSVWGTIRLSNASAWTTASNSNRTDAVSAATRRSEGPISATWNCTNTSEAAVPDGMYTVNITATESDSIPFFGGSTPTGSVKFTKSAAGDMQMGTDTQYFTGMQVTLTEP